jgi:hypothetical protein
MNVCNGNKHETGGMQEGMKHNNITEIFTNQSPYVLLFLWISLYIQAKGIWNSPTNIDLGNKYSKFSLIQTNWEQTLIQISENPNYRSVTENMFREVTK